MLWKDRTRKFPKTPRFAGWPPYEGVKKIGTNKFDQNPGTGKSPFLTPRFCHTEKSRGVEVLIFDALKRSDSKLAKDATFREVAPM